MREIIGVKSGMTRVFDGDRSVAVSVVDIADTVVCYVDDKGVELGSGGKLSKPNKALSGKYKKLGYVPKYRVWFTGEFDLKVGDKVKVEDWGENPKVHVTGKSKGKGFAGVVKRWGFAGGPKTHGQSDRHRAPGSIGAGTDPGRVLKGKKMPGRMGTDTTTVLNKRIVAVGDGYLLISGAVPGNKGGLISIEVAE